MATVNKADLATALKVSLPTLGAMMRREGEAFPIVSKGTNGREYEFDLDAVAAYLQRRADEAEAAGRERDELLRQFTLPGIERADDAKLSPSERLQLARTREIERREQKEAGFLVETSAVRATLSNAFIRFNRNIDTAIRQAMRESNIPDVVIRQVEARIAESKTRCVRDINAYLEGGTLPDDADAQTALV